MPPPPAGPTEALRLFSRHLHGALAGALPDGPTLLLRSGDGVFARARKGLLVTDLTPGPGVLVVCDPEELPFPTGYFTAVAGFDVLGRCPRPARILMEAERILEPGGRLLLVEPWTGPFGMLAHMRTRRCRGGLDPWFDAGDDNASTATTCLSRRASELPKYAGGLKIVQVEPFGGPSEVVARRGDVPGVRRWMAREDRLPRWLRGLLGTRALFVLEKS